MSQDREKTAYLTLLSVCSMIAVVILHANVCFWSFSTEMYWVSANVIESVFYFAVPIFFMISGATLLDYRERYDTRTFLKKRALKTVIPFLFWGGFGMWFCASVLHSAEWKGVLPLINGILNVEYVGIYWFFLTLFALYGAIILLSLVPREKKVKTFGWAAAVLFATSSAIPFFLTVFHTGIHWPLDPGSPTHYLLYIFLGYYLSRKEIRLPYRVLSYVLAAAGLLLHILGTYYTSVQAGTIVSDYKGYLNLPCVLYAVGIFLFFKQHGNRVMRAFPGKIIRVMAPYSFTVYLLHWYLLNLIRLSFANHGVMVDHALWYRLGSVFLIVPVCMLVGFIIRKTPVLRYLLPS